MLNNQAPEIYFNDLEPLFLHNYPNNTINKEFINANLIDMVIDDRDGIIDTNILNIQLFKFGESVLNSGFNTIFVPYSSSSTSFDGEYFEIIPDTEVLAVVEKGLYFARVTVYDSDNAVTIEDKPFTVFD